MCRTMKELQTISERIYELEQKKAKKKKEMDALEKEIKELKSETSSYMKKRQKNELTVAGLTVLFTKMHSSKKTVKKAIKNIQRIFQLKESL